MADVFISYASENRDRAQRLAGALAARGWSIWWDREIVTGQAFDHAIERELEAAKAVVVLWSAQSVASEWVRNEAAAAAERGVLLPANIDGTKLPLEFRRKQTADLEGWNGAASHEGFRALCNAIGRLAGGAREPAGPLDGPAQPLRPVTAAPGRPRGGRLLAMAVAVLAVGLGGVVLLARDEATRAAPAAVPMAAGGATGGGPGAAAVAGPGALVDTIVGTYLGEVIADSKGSSRSGVSVRLEKLSADTVRVSSPYARIGSLDISVMPMQGKVSNAGGDTPLLVDLEASPPTLVLDPRGELAFRGTRQR
jgi:hypothetical protein